MTDTQLIERPSSQTGLSVPHWLIPQSIKDCEVMATKMCLAEWLPYSYKNKRTGEYDRNKVELAIMHGATVGIPAIMAPQVIAVIGNIPTVWGDGMLALVLSSGLAEDIKEYYEGEGNELTAYCIAKRRGIPSPAEGKYSVAMAKGAGLLGKEGPWQTAPARMLKMRARAFALRDRFADVLKGLRMAEEVLDEIIDVTPAAAVPTERPQREDFRPENSPVQDIEPAPKKTAKKKAEEPAPPEPETIPDPEPPAEPSQVVYAFTLVMPDGDELPYEDPLDFRKAYLTHMDEAAQRFGLPGLDGYYETNRATVLKWAANNKPEAVELERYYGAIRKAMTAPGDEPKPAGEKRLF